MRLTRSRHAADLAEFALRELEAIVEDPWSGGLQSERDIELQVDLRHNEALAMALRVGSIIYDEAKGNSFIQWWETTAQDPRFRSANRIRNLEFKRGERGQRGTVVIFQDNEGAGTTSDPRVMLRSSPFEVIVILREYLSWCESDLIPGAEQRSL